MSTSVANKGGILVEMNDMVRKSGYRVRLALPIVILLECIARVILYFRPRPILMDSTEKQTASEGCLKRTGMHRDDHERDRLSSWLRLQDSRPLFRTTSVAHFSSRVEMECTFAIAGMIEAGFRFAGWMVLNDANNIRTAQALQEKIRKLDYAENIGGKEENDLEAFFTFLDDITHSDVESVASFLRQLAQLFQSKPYGWFSIILQDSQRVIEFEFDASIIVLGEVSLMIKAGGGVSSYYKTGVWKQSGRFCACAWNVIMSSILDQIGTNPLVKSQRRGHSVGMDAFFLSGVLGSYKAVFSRWVPKHGKLYTFLVFLDVVISNSKKFSEVR